MSNEKLSVGDRVLLQSGRYVKEHASVEVFLDNGNILMKLSDGKLSEFNPRYVLKIFK